MAKKNGKHQNGILDQARDELFSHIVRCNVLEATEEDQVEWLQETMEYMSERYPDLTALQVAQLEMLGKRYISPAIPHGRGKNALNQEALDQEGDDDGGERSAA